jgi:antitoxin MazE
LVVKVTTQLWGNSLGLRIPAPVAREAKLSHGSEVDLQFEGGRIVLTPLRQTKRYKLRALLSKVTRENAPEADVWGAPVGREVW